MEDLLVRTALWNWRVRSGARFRRTLTLLPWFLLLASFFAVALYFQSVLRDDQITGGVIGAVVLIALTIELIGSFLVVATFGRRVHGAVDPVLPVVRWPYLEPIAVLVFAAGIGLAALH